MVRVGAGQRAASRMSVTLSGDDVSASGHVYLMQWLHDKWDTAAARHVVWQVSAPRLYLRQR
eukprot:363737-Chlamydomonas_euryale.AAC.13